jgi:hypothetical protein
MSPLRSIPVTVRPARSSVSRLASRMRWIGRPSRKRRTLVLLPRHVSRDCRCVQPIYPERVTSTGSRTGSSCERRPNIGEAALRHDLGARNEITYTMLRHNGFHLMYSLAACLLSVQSTELVRLFTGRAKVKSVPFKSSLAQPSVEASDESILLRLAGRGVLHCAGRRAGFRARTHSFRKEYGLGIGRAGEMEANLICSS